MLIDYIETQIISRLKEKISGLHIEGFPDKPQQFKLVHPKGAILVHYQGASYSTTKSLCAVFQQKKMEFALTIIAKNLRTNKGAYGYLEQVKSALTGYEIEGCTKLYPIKENFLAEDAGIWQYAINFALTTQVIEEE